MREDGMINTSKRSISYLRLNDVLFSARMLISNRTWVSSFNISSRQTAVFLWQSISNARIDGRILKVTKSARYSRAEPEEKMSFLISGFRISRQNMKSKARFPSLKSVRKVDYYCYLFNFRCHEFPSFAFF